MPIAQNSYYLSFIGSGKAKKSTLTYPKTLYLYKDCPIIRLIEAELKFYREF